MGKKRKSGSIFLSGLYYFIILYTLGNFWSMYLKNYNVKEPMLQYSNIVTDSNNLDGITKKLEKEFSINIEEDKKDEYAVLNSVYENNNLTSSEKKVFYGFYSVIDDFVDMDRESAYDSLSRVYVKYSSNKNTNVLGDYNYKSGKINIYTYNDKNNEVLIHEGIHCLFNNDKTESLPIGFTEGMTELIANEYFSNDPFYEGNSYPFEISYVKMLCELVGTDTVIKAFSTGDFTLITNKVDIYNNSGISTYKLFDIYEDSFSRVTRGTNYKYNLSERWDAYDAMMNIYKSMHPNLGNYRDFNYLYELSASVFEENPTEFYADYINYYGVLEKAYISNNLKSNYSTSKYTKFIDREKVNAKR